MKLNALLVQWPRRFEPSDVSVQWLTTIHNSHGSVMDVVILVVVILSHNQYNRSQGTDSLFKLKVANFIYFPWEICLHRDFHTGDI